MQNEIIFCSFSTNTAPIPPMSPQSFLFPLPHPAHPTPIPTLTFAPDAIKPTLGALHCRVGFDPHRSHPSPLVPTPKSMVPTLTRLLTTTNMSTGDPTISLGLPKMIYGHPKLFVDEPEMSGGVLNMAPGVPEFFGGEPIMFFGDPNIVNYGRNALVLTKVK